MAEFIEPPQGINIRVIDDHGVDIGCLLEGPGAVHFEDFRDDDEYLVVWRIPYGPIDLTGLWHGAEKIRLVHMLTSRRHQMLMPQRYQIVRGKAQALQAYHECARQFGGLSFNPPAFFIPYPLNFSQRLLWDARDRATNRRFVSFRDHQVRQAEAERSPVSLHSSDDET